MNFPTYNAHDANTAIIAGLYKEVPLNTRIFTKGLMLPQLACRTQPGIYMHLKNKYSTKRENGELKVMAREIAKTIPQYNTTAELIKVSPSRKYD